MFSYTRSMEFSREIFAETCRMLETSIPEIAVTMSLEDVDGSEIRAYVANGRTIKVFNDAEVDAVYVDSEFDLTDILHV